MKVLTGAGVSAGIAMGHALKVDRGVPPIYKIRLSEGAVDAELARFDEAVALTTRQLMKVQEMLASELGPEHSLMIQSHIMILQDQQFSGTMREIIREESVNAEWAVKVVKEKIQQVYEKLEDSYLKEKIHDIQGIARLLVANIAGRSGPDHPDSYENVIMVNHEINLALLSDLNLKHLKGFAVDFGGWTAHTSIIARSLKIPSVIHLHDITRLVHTGDFLIVDGSSGAVYINPDPKTVARFKGLQEQQALAGAAPVLEFRKPARKGHLPGTLLYLNTEFPMELADYAALRVEGIGLFRSEFMFMGTRIEEITMEEHEAVYRDLADRIHPQVANIRTFDLGTDKVPELKERFRETNPALGMRGIRLSIEFQEAFRRQLLGLLRANIRGNLRVTFPFISSEDEVRTARQILADVRDAQPPGTIRPLPVGVMLEIPSTFFIVAELADAVDFFTLGTNDLVQYTLARDRSDFLGLSQFYSAHPAVRRGLELICRTCVEKGKEVICCGEMAAHPFFLLMLLGAGFRSFSVNRPSLPLVRYILSNVDRERLDRFYGSLQRLTSVIEIEQFFLTRLEEFFSPVFVNTLRQAFRDFA